MAETLLNWFINSAFARTLASLATAFVLGTLIGAERQWRQRSAGLRTNVLVAIGAAAFTDLGARLLGTDGATRIILYVVSGIGFLGAGVILKEGTQIRGLNTAATLWCSAAVGIFAGAEFWAEAGALSVFVVSGNTLLRPLVNYISHLPIDTLTTEARYRVHVVTEHREFRPRATFSMKFLGKSAIRFWRSKRCRKPKRRSNWRRSWFRVPSSADAALLDAVVVQLEKAQPVRSATWPVSTTP